MSDPRATGGVGGAEVVETAAADRETQLARLEAAIGYAFSDRAGLEAALRHSSYAYERAQRDGIHREDEGGEPGVPEHRSNERLEFLGDAVLGLVVAEALYTAHPHWSEGDLTRALHRVVEGRSLATLARSLGVGEALRLGRTEEASAGHEKPSILEDAMEALLGAIYLDGGLDPVRALVERHFAGALTEARPPVARDPKTALQEDLMAEVGAFPTYHLVVDSGLEGDDRRFEMSVRSGEIELARGIGRTKRAAEKEAARAALAKRAEVRDAEPRGEGEEVA